MIRLHKIEALPVAGMTGFEAPLSEEESATRTPSPLRAKDKPTLCIDEQP